MKISGNGNARAFFKKHGVTEAQMTVKYYLFIIFKVLIVFLFNVIYF
jgi:hypothetical protein